MMKSLFTPLIGEKLTTLRILYNWEKNLFTFMALKEWDKDFDFSGYNKDFFIDDICTDDAVLLNNGQVISLFKKYDLLDYLGEIMDMMKDGRHYAIDCMYNSRKNIKLICHKHSNKAGINNRRSAMYLDGIRRYEIDDDELDMIREGLNISRGMTYKLIAAGLNYGGSKTMIKMPELDLNDMESLGFIAYAFDRNKCVTGADMKFPPAIADVMNENFTSNFTSGPKSPLGISGIPTAYGVYYSLKKAVLFYENTESLDGKTVVLMGLGAVGWTLGNLLLEEDAKLYVSDIDVERVDRFKREHLNKNVEYVPVSEALYKEVDIISPCAVGNLINKENIENLKCRYIWGSANNQLIANTKEEQIELARILEDKGIHFEIEWWFNTGGVLCAAYEYEYGKEASFNELIDIVDNNIPAATWNNLNEANKLGITSTENAYRLCEKYLYENEQIH